MKYCVVTVNVRVFSSILQNEIWKFFRLLSFTFKGMLTDIGTDRQHSLNFITLQSHENIENFRVERVTGLGTHLALTRPLSTTGSIDRCLFIDFP